MRSVAVGIAAGLAVLAIVAVSQQKRTVKPGPVESGGNLTVTGWKVNPVGTQIPVETLPMASALSADGKRLLVLNGGYNPPTISVIDAVSLEEISRTRVKDGWLGLTFSGGNAFVGGGSTSAVHEFRLQNNKLEAVRSLLIPGGHFVGHVTATRDGSRLWATSLYGDRVFTLDRKTGAVTGETAARRPYRTLETEDGKSVWISHWSAAQVTRHDARTGQTLETVKTGEHPTDMAFGLAGKLYVAASNTNTVNVIEGGRVVETINVAMTPRMPPGMTPASLTFSTDRKRLYVTCSDANVVAVVEIGERSRVAGFIPTGWYPTASQLLADGRLVILNGRGLQSHPNPKGPHPERTTTYSTEGIRADQYVGAIQRGTVQVVHDLTPAALARYTRQAFANTPYQDKQLDAKSAFPPIEHVVYIIKENRTYDQMLGDMKEGNGDPSLLLFGEQVSPNHHKLARDFVLLDNFYVNADVSADGHNWSMAAIAPDYVQKTWPNQYGRRGKHFTFPSQEPAARAPSGYLWDRVAEAGKTIRNYGYLGVNRDSAPAGGPQLSDVRDPVLKPVTNTNYRAYEIDYPDVERARVLIADVQSMEKMPSFTLVRLGNDHTFGAAPGKLSPKALVADNDLALGRIVEGLSKTKFWPRMAIFVLEDDSQAGPDHVDSHRAPAYVISPYTRRGVVDSTFYNTTSMLRSMELILGAKPMTIFDASSARMYSVFQAKPDTRPYEHAPARQSLTEKNPQQTALAVRTQRLDFDEADLNDDGEMNDILWRMIRGTEPPPPVRSYWGR